MYCEMNVIRYLKQLMKWFIASLYRFLGDGINVRAFASFPMITHRFKHKIKKNRRRNMLSADTPHTRADLVPLRCSRCEHKRYRVLQLSLIDDLYVFDELFLLLTGVVDFQPRSLLSQFQKQKMEICSSIRSVLTFQCSRTGNKLTKISIEIVYRHAGPLTLKDYQTIG